MLLDLEKGIRKLRSSSRTPLPNLLSKTRPYVVFTLITKLYLKLTVLYKERFIDANTKVVCNIGEKEYMPKKGAENNRIFPARNFDHNFLKMWYNSHTSKLSL